MNKNGEREMQFDDEPLDPVTDWVNRAMAPVMFVASLLFLALLGTLIVCWVDIPRVTAVELEGRAHLADPFVDDAEWRFERASIELGWVIYKLLLAVWPFFWIERLLSGWAQRRSGFNRSELRWRRRLTNLAVCVCPPMRMAAPNETQGHRIWLPGMGWQPPGRELSEKLERVFGTPMLIIALLILPILLIEFGFHDFVARHHGLRIALHVSTGLIWCAFAVEFIIRFSATDRKLAYVKKNWIDLAIVILPLISFLRSVRVMRAAKLMKASQFQKLSKLFLVYRMRGLGLKAARAFVVLDLLDRLMKRTPEQRIERLQNELKERMEEVHAIEKKIRALRVQCGNRAAPEKNMPDMEMSEREMSGAKMSEGKTPGNKATGTKAPNANRSGDPPMPRSKTSEASKTPQD